MLVPEILHGSWKVQEAEIKFPTWRQLFHWEWEEALVLRDAEGTQTATAVVRSSL